MSTKFDKAFIEIRTYIPMEGEPWESFKATELYQGLVKDGLRVIQAAPRKKGGSHER